MVFEITATHFLDFFLFFHHININILIVSNVTIETYLFMS